jgi:hypothetical protein
MVPEEKMILPAASLPAALLLACLLWSCATTASVPRTPPGQKEFFIPAPDEELFGTWLLDSPATAGAPGRLKIYSWGLLECATQPDAAVIDWQGTSLIDLAWTDAKGSRWFREYRRYSDRQPHEGGEFVLSSVSADGLVLESVFSLSGWPQPTDLDLAGDPTFLRYRRLE